MAEQGSEATAHKPHQDGERAQLAERIDTVMASQRALFESGVTRPRAYREEQLRALYQAVSRREDRLIEALREDLGRPTFEGYLAEVGFVLAETRHALKNLKSWMRPRTLVPPIVTLPSLSRIHYQPLGLNLIISPWNYPLNLALAPLVGALSAGNTAVLKPSELAPATCDALTELIGDTFPEDLVAVIDGGADTAKILLERRWDHVFFTGGTRVGRIVARAAAEHLSRVTLELGGKSPTIVMDSADLDVASRRICWGKFVNAGQTCLAPDYVLVHEAVHDALLQRMTADIQSFYGSDPQASPHFGRIVNLHHFERLRALIDPDKVMVGGQADASDRYIAPTVMRDVEMSDAVMAEEIFGPILPVLAVRDLGDAMARVAERPNPLALYLFTTSPEDERQVIERISFGGGCINNTLAHFGDAGLPFGGIGESGVGAYHGFHSFEVFSHRKGIVKSANFLDLDVRYPPYDARKLGILRKVMR